MSSGPISILLRLGLAIVLPVLSAGCGGDQSPPRVSGSFAVRASIEQLHIWNAPPGAGLIVLDPGGAVVHQEPADEQGSLVVRGLPSGDGYAVCLADPPDDCTDRLAVLSEEESQPDPSFYEQELTIGYGYLTVRDGTTLSAFVSLPGPPEAGPYPTLISYSGYTPSRPGRPVGGIAEAYCDDYPVLCNAPDHPEGIIAGVMGYATVGVNLRGTGCSGGAYDYFEPLQLLDGYDVVEIVARQPWVKHGKVGMIGLSFPGITQLFVASVRPPSLAAIAPFSVIADTATSTLVPGGIYNNGFAIEWIAMVLDRADPYAHGWVRDLVEAGDTVCEENQLLHSQKLNAVQKAYENPFYTDEVAGPLDPSRFVDRIEVPVFLAGQAQDEQTGPHYPVLFDRFTGSPSTRFTTSNGVHMDGFAPQVLGELFNFLALYVDRSVPYIAERERQRLPMFMAEVFGSWGLSLPPGRFERYPTLELARAAWEAEDRVRVIFESGADPDVTPGAPQGTFEAGFPAWPIPNTVPLRLFLQPGGALAGTAPEEGGGASSFEHDPEAGGRGTLASGSVDPPQPDWAWRQPEPGRAVSFVGPPLEESLVLVGHGSADLWLRSPVGDADLEVMLTEVRPDGRESLIQTGWLRASHRTLKPESTELRPISSHYERDVRPLEPSVWTLVRVEIMPMIHILRPGSRLRLLIDTPGDSCARWRFDLLLFDRPPVYDIGHHAGHLSSVVLPVITGVDVPTGLPDCTALRGQPCRDYLTYDNRPSAE